MALRPIFFFPHPLLKKTSQPIEIVDDGVRALLADLEDSLRATPGVALAAPQIGVLRRAIVVDVSRAARPGKPAPKGHGFVAMLNPRILERRGTQTVREGCLSVPDFLADVRRDEWIRVEGLDAQGAPALLEIEGFEALAFQHEIDHLDGTLFLDRVASLRMGLFRRKI